MNLKSVISFALFAIFTQSLSAQTGTDRLAEGLKTITLEECIERAVESNYSIIISSNSLEITKNNVTYSPFLPSVSLTSRQSSSSSDQRNYSSEGVRENSVVKSASVINSANVRARPT